jgi:hypothetical protein
MSDVAACLRADADEWLNKHFYALHQVHAHYIRNLWAILPKIDGGLFNTQEISQINSPSLLN